ncbi:hypothetical protein BC830DRAFT_1116723 [Chytriomyces sp. MP71]|nr:hypothetical protein BC830DRAFT_1116723 [Chytriomyces sp. MP71]
MMHDAAQLTPHKLLDGLPKPKLHSPRLHCRAGPMQLPQPTPYKASGEHPSFFPDTARTLLQGDTVGTRQQPPTFIQTVLVAVRARKARNLQ